MKQIVLVAFLIAAGCTRQLDCDAAVDQGIKRLTAGFRAYAPDPQTVESGTRTLEQIQGTLVRRCTIDRWPAEVTQCFATMDSGTDLQACQSRLSPDHASRLSTEIAEATRRREAPVAECKPPVPAGRVARVRDARRAAFEMMNTYKIDLCQCNDHDLNCGKVATDAFQRAITDWVAHNDVPPADLSEKPDPEMEKLTQEVADCSRRVMTPAPGLPGGGPP
jgi:hypothetical protein